jgi:hypothetical protein
MPAVIQKTVRLAVEGNQVVLQELRTVGTQGEAALSRIGVGAKTANDNLETMGRTGGRSAAQARADFVNLGQQIQDVAVQAQAGTSWFTIMAQQGPQIASAFSFLNPMTGIFVAIGAAVAGVVYNMGLLGEETLTAEERTNRLDRAMANARSTIGATANTVDELTRRYAALNAQQLQVERNLLRARIDEAKQMQELSRRNLGDVAGALANPGAAAGLARLSQQEQQDPRNRIERDPELDRRIAALAKVEELQRRLAQGKGSVQDALDLRGLLDQYPKIVENQQQVANELSIQTQAAQEADDAYNRLNAQLAVLEQRSTAADAATIATTGSTAAAGKANDAYGDTVKRLTTDILKAKDARKGFIQEQLDRLPADATPEQRAEVQRLAEAYFDASKKTDAYGDSVKRLATDLLKTKDARKGFIQEQLDRLPAEATAEQRAEVERLAGAYFDSQAASRAAHTAQVTGARQAKAAVRDLAAEHQRDLDLLDRLAIRAEGRTNDLAERVRASGRQAVEQLSESGEKDPGMVARTREAGENVELRSAARRREADAIREATRANTEADRVLQRALPLQDAYLKQLADIESATLTKIRLNPQLAETYRQIGEAAKQAAGEENREALRAEAERKRQAQMDELELTGGAGGGVTLWLDDLRQETMSVASMTRETLGGAWQATGDIIRNTILGVKTDFKAMAASFIADTAAMIAQQMLLRGVMGLFGGGAGATAAPAAGGGFLSMFAPILGVFGRHQGGRIESGIPDRNVPAAAFDNAVRRHDGGPLGLGPDEVPFIGLRGERVLNRKEAREWEERRESAVTVNQTLNVDARGSQDPGMVGAVVRLSANQARREMRQELSSARRGRMRPGRG